MPKKKKPDASFSLKDQLFNRERVEYLASLFAASGSQFDASGFIRQTMSRLTKLELKQRIEHIAVTLEDFLASDYRIAAKQIASALPPPLDPTKSDDDFGDFIFAPLGEFVVRNGLSKSHVKLSLRTLKQLTMRFSMEDAIRAFINEHPQPTLAELSRWADDKNYHVRRLVSEGTRPTLPWSKRLTIDIDRPIEFLDRLHADPTRYVTRSVSNHLNDIAKVSPGLVLDRLQAWRDAEEQDPTELAWMSRHALRTLVKQGNPKALRFLGYRPNPKIDVVAFELSDESVRPGEAIELSVELTADRSESLMIDYVIEFVKANGKRSPKVHKFKQLEVRKGETVSLRKKHPFRADATTFTLYPGEHHVTLQINGKSFGTRSFEME